ncbi:MAG: leucyl aminopeptidase [Planctomycetia bacterium]|nr:leucyl aminopeptidase [Planctomycetia bacterium]
MPLTAQFAPLYEITADWLIVPVFEEEGFSGPLAALDQRLGGALSRLWQAGDVTSKPIELTPLLDVRGAAVPRVMIVGLGKRAALERSILTDAATAAARCVTDRPRRRVAFALPSPTERLGWEELALAAGVGLMQGSQGPGVRKTEPVRFVPDDLCLIAPPGADADAVQRGARRADIEGRAVALARELVNMPPSDLYPETFAALALEMAGAVGIACTVLDETQLESEKFGSLLGVARGSERPPRLVLLHWQGAEKPTRLGYVGKGVTFDSGGLSLKANDQMLDMKCDMAGAAAVLASILAIAELRLPVDVLGILALVENMPSGKALKLGDVLKARNGVTIEVLNTDAEGRLILADALAYAVDLRATHLVDLATLTGACMVALGEQVAGLMGNNETWNQQVQSAAQRAGERVWPLPMWPIYNDLIKSEVADIKNVSGKRYGGAIVGAKFLERFVGTTPWVHLDIAGPAWAEHASPIRDAGGTGCMVRTLVELAAAK